MWVKVSVEGGTQPFGCSPITFEPAGVTPTGLGGCDASPGRSRKGWWLFQHL